MSKSKVETIWFPPAIPVHDSTMKTSSFYISMASVVKYRFWVLLIQNQVDFCIQVTGFKRNLDVSLKLRNVELTYINWDHGILHTFQPTTTVPIQYCLAVLSLVEILGEFRNLRRAVIRRCVGRKPNSLDLKLSPYLPSIACFKSRLQKFDKFENLCGSNFLLSDSFNAVNS